MVLFWIEKRKKEACFPSELGGEVYGHFLFTMPKAFDLICLRFLNHAKLKKRRYFVLTK